MEILVEIIKTNPLLYAFFVVVSSLSTGIGAGFGLYKGIDKLFSYWIKVKINTDQIPALIDLNKDNHSENQQELENLKKILENHNLQALEIKDDVRKILEKHDKEVKEKLKKIS